MHWNFKNTYYDEYTQEELPEAATRATITDELTHFNANVWVSVDLPEARMDNEGKLMNGRFAFCNKADLQNPDCRARYVACEIHTNDDAAFFAATPPLEANGVLFNQ